jgi:serine protease Do
MNHGWRSVRWCPLLIVCLDAGCGGGRPEPSPTVTIDFYQASGIAPEQLVEWLEQQSAGGKDGSVPLELTLHDAQGDILVQSRVEILWNSGRHRLIVSRSGIIGFTLDKSKLNGLRIVAPEGYNTLRQRTVPLGSAYEPEEEPAVAQADYTVTYNGRILGALKLHLQQLRSSGRVVSYETLRSQLRRRHTPLHLTEPPEQNLTPAEIFRLRRSSVVVVGSLDDSGKVLEAGGVIVDGCGVILTAYHVVDKPPSVTARGVLTWDGRFFPLQEVLAADPAADLCVLKVDADGLAAAPVSPGDSEGTPITLLSHPGGNFFSLTQGYISRYWAQTSFGRTVVTMAITADFADGASGGPVFNNRGAVTGIISYTLPLSNQMVLRECGSVREIRRLFAEPDGS